MERVSDMKRNKIRKDDLPKLMQMIDGGRTEEKCVALRLLCPCRNRVYDVDVWRRIFEAMETGNPEVQHQAAHAIGTLRERAQRDPQSQELLAQLKDDVERVMKNPQARAMLLNEQKIGRERIHGNEIPQLVRVLDEGTSEEKSHVLRLLCPCRNRVYDIEVWRKIFEAHESGDPGVRHDAAHTIGTLQQRALIDPRSWKLLLQLEQELGQNLRQGIIGISLWGPRSRPSRRKRMTYCKTGRLKALASLQFSQLDEPNGADVSSERPRYDDLFPKPVRRERELVTV